MPDINATDKYSAKKMPQPDSVDGGIIFPACECVVHI